MRQILALIAVFALFAAPAPGQVEQEYGRVLTVSGKTLTVQFGQRDIKVGDEIDFWRFTSIIDPVTGVERGRPKTLVGKGIVDEIGLGKASVSITEQSPSNRITVSDMALPTGEKKKMTPPKVARIEEISADKKEMTIDLGTKDEISEGDMFLIQRTENLYDQKTKQITGTSQVDVGRGRVSAVKDRSSTAAITILQPGMEVLKTDTVVFNPEQKKPAPEPGEFEQLKKEVAALKVTVDSLGAAQLLSQSDFLTLKREIESIVPSLSSLDRDADRIVMKNVETVLAKRSGGGTVMTRYRRALDDCLKRRIPRAQKEFQEIMDSNPDIPLVENCRYWISQCRFSAKDYPAAAAGFQTVLDDTRFAHKDDDASIMLGITFFQMSRLSEALDQLHRFVESFPKSEYRGKVEQWIERISLIKSRG